MILPVRVRFSFITCILFLFNFNRTTSAEDASHLPPVEMLISQALKNAPTAAVADADLALRKITQSHTDLNKYIPGVDIYGAKSMLWPHHRNDWVGIQTVGMQFSFDLQHMFGPESAIAAEAEYFGQVQARLERRNIVRLVKNYCTTLYYSQQGLAEARVLEAFLSSLRGMVGRMRSYGVFVGVEENLLNAEAALLRHEIILRNNERATLLVQLALLTGLGEDELQRLTQAMNEPVKLAFARFSPQSLRSLTEANDSDMLANLSKEYNALKAEYEHFSTVPMPTAFFRVFTQQNSTSPILGPNEGVEFGFTYPIGNLIPRHAHHSELKEKINQTAALMKKNLMEYRAAIRTTGLHRLELENEIIRLSSDRERMKKFLPNAPALYRQRRIDMSGILDLMRKYWDTTKLYFSEAETISRLDAELEYLTGSKAQ